jgi:hypothetical protein
VLGVPFCFAADAGGESKREVQQELDFCEFKMASSTVDCDRSEKANVENASRRTLTSQ